MTAKKNKSGTKKTFYCDICNVTVYGAEIFEIHLKGKKHQKIAPLSKSCDGIGYIQRYHHDDYVVFECELCDVRVLDVVKHLNSSTHIFTFVKVNYPKVYENLHRRGLHNIWELRKIAVTGNYPEEFQQYVNSCSPMLMEENLNHKGITRNEDCEPPRKMRRMDDPPCNDISATISDHMREKNSGVDQNEKTCTASDKRLIESDCEDYKECKTESNLKHNGFESPSKITCKKDLYNFLQYFQVSDETDVIFIQQIVKKFKSQLQEFYENDKPEKATIGVNDDKNQQKDKLIAHTAECTLQQADSTITSNANESGTYKSTDIKDHCEGEFTTSNTGHIGKKLVVRPSALTSVLKSIATIKKEPDDDAAVEEPLHDCTTLFKSVTKTDLFSGNTKETIITGQSRLKDAANCSFPAVSINREPESVFSPPIPILSPNSDKLMLKETIKSLSASSPEGSRKFSERKNNLLASSAQNTCLASPDFIASCQDQLPVKSFVTPLTINKEPLLSNADVSSTSSPKAANSPLIKFSHSDFCTSDVSSTASLHNSCSMQSTAGIYSTFRELPKMYSANIPISGQNPLSTSKEIAASSLSGNKDEQALASSVCTSPLCCSQPSQESSPKFSQPDQFKPCNVSDELPMSTSGCCSSETCTIKTLGHSSMSKLGTDQPLSMYLDSSLVANKNKPVPAVEKPIISHLNALPSPINTYDAYSTTFGGKENMRISELIAEVAKFAETKPVLKGIDINQVVQILIQNRSEETGKGSHNSTL